MRRRFVRDSGKRRSGSAAEKVRSHNTVPAPGVEPGTLRVVYRFSLLGCNQQQCVQTFDSARLAVRTVHGSDDRPTRRPGRARAHVQSTFLTERRPQTDMEGAGRAGHVLQLIDPWGDGPTNAAEQLAAFWAQQGLHTSGAPIGE